MPSADVSESLPEILASDLPRHPKPFSISLSSKNKATTVLPSKPSVNIRKRPHSSLADDSDSADDAHYDHTSQLVSTFDHTAGGAIGVEGKVQAALPLVIQGQKNRNWREESQRKKGKNILPAEEQAARQGRGVGKEDTGNSEQESYGLTIVRRKDNDGDLLLAPAGDVMIENKRNVMTADEEALEALLEGKKKSDLVLPAIRNGDEAEAIFTSRATEIDAFKSDIASRPESASIEDYTAVPIEEFGVALLRGMGWKEGDVVGKRKDQSSKPRVVERRPALLGIGAKEVPEGLEELGAWGKGAKKKNMYTKGLAPVLLKNSKTGEMLTEEELKVKKEQQQKDIEDWRERRDRNLQIDEGRKAERRRREKDKSYDNSRQSSSRRQQESSHELSRSRHDRERDRRRPPKEYEPRDDSRSSRHRHHERDDCNDARSRGRTEVY